MSFPLNIYLLALAGAWLTTGITLPLWRRFCTRTKLVDDPGHRKIHAEPIPLAGGLAVITGILLPVVAATVVLNFPLMDTYARGLLVHGLGRRGGQFLVLLLGAVGMVFLGWLDDRYELKPGLKFLGQFFIAAAVAAAGIRITLFIPSLIFSYALTIFWILAVTNALNLMDNMNGLCAGVGVIGTGYFALAAAFHGQYLVTITALLACGALLGFLPYNYPRASAFLGDAGSHLTGFLLSVLAILPHFYSARYSHPHALAVLSPLLILAVPLGDMAWVVVLRWRLGKPFYIGDNNHLSHRLTRRGFSRAQAVLLIWLLTLGTGSLSLWLL